MFRIVNGDSLIELDKLEPNSIDSIVCDPPYEINFMNKGWDNSGIAYNVDLWKKCLNVLKSGSFMLVFGGSRTFHRVMCAIEDAGFYIKDTMMWLYGCLSSDTEILTSNGWKNSETIKEDDFIYSLDLQENKLIKNKCLKVFKYEYNGKMVNLKNQNTDQLLTPNHHCIVKDIVRTRIKGQTNYSKHDSWCYKDAWQVKSNTIDLPLAGNYDGKLEIGNLQAELLGLVISDGSYHIDSSGIFIYQTSANQEIIKRIHYILGKLNLKYHEYIRERSYQEQYNRGLVKIKEEKLDKTYKEYSFYINSCELTKKFRELCPNKKLNWGLLELSQSNKEFLIKGLCEGDGGKATHTILGYDVFYQKDFEQLEIFQALLHLTNKQGWINYKHYSCSIHSNPTTQIQRKHTKNFLVDYNGKYVWCIETEIGNFVARRNGKIFITGNSAMPKGENIGLAIDKRNGVESKVVATMDAPSLKDTGKKQKELGNGGSMTFGQISNAERLQYEIKEAQNEWNGWNTALKPAFEVIIVAQKPIEEKTIVDNVLKWGVGAYNIDECRIPISSEDDYDVNNRPISKAKGSDGDGHFLDELHDYDAKHGVTSKGRYPSNLILTYDDETFNDVCGGFPDTKSSPESPNANHTFKGNKDAFEWGFKDRVVNASYNDSGNACRYFYSAKASKKDRDEGLECFKNVDAYVLKDNVDENTIKQIQFLLDNN